MRARTYARARITAAALLLLLVAAFASGPRGVGEPDGPGTERWVGAWAAPAVNDHFPAISDQSVRVILRPTIEGTAVRVRLSNRFGTTAVTLRSLSVARRTKGASIARTSARPITFAGVATVTIPPGADVTSDAVPFRYERGDDLAVSFHAPATTGPMTGHAYFATSPTSYRTAPGLGDHAGDASGVAFTQSSTERYYVEALDALVRGGEGTVVAFGDSLTDGTLRVVDGHATWPEVLAERLHRAGRRYGVVNVGISGNTVTPCPPAEAVFGDAATVRFRRDALRFPNVRSIVVLAGGNDLRLCGWKSAADVLGGLDQLVAAGRAAGARVLLGTYPPRVARAPADPESAPDSLGDDVRVRLNTAIRGRTAPEVVDFDAVLRDPRRPGRLSRRTGTVDGIHPGVAGMRQMARAIPLDDL